LLWTNIAYKVLSYNLKRKFYFGDADVDGRIILTWIVKK